MRERDRGGWMRAIGRAANRTTAAGMPFSNNNSHWQMEVIFCAFIFYLDYALCFGCSAVHVCFPVFLLHLLSIHSLPCSSTFSTRSLFSLLSLIPTLYSLYSLYSTISTLSLFCPIPLLYLVFLYSTVSHVFFSSPE